MNLEAIEQRVLAYLKQVQNPLVRISTLLNYVRSVDEFGTISESDLVDFLEHHELFRVIPPAQFAETLGPALASAGLLDESAVILVTRIPPPGQVAAMMTMQIDLMREALSAALREALEHDDEVRVQRIRRLLERTQKLREKLVPAPDNPKSNGS